MMTMGGEADAERRFLPDPFAEQSEVRNEERLAASQGDFERFEPIDRFRNLLNERQGERLRVPLPVTVVTGEVAGVGQRDAQGARRDAPQLRRRRQLIAEDMRPALPIEQMDAGSLVAHSHRQSPAAMPGAAPCAASFAQTP